jgi:hypothetical protein
MLGRFYAVKNGEDFTMNRKLFCLISGAVLCVSAVAQAAVYDNVYWVGGSGEWTGDLSPNTAVTPDYATGHWSASPSGPGLPAKFVLGRNDGIRVGEAIGAGGYDLDRLPCNNAANCTTDPPVTIAAGVQLGTDMYINTGATVTYNPNRQLLNGDDALDRFGDFRIQPNANFPGTPVLSLSNGSVFDHKTAVGGDADGMWTRWNGAELNLDGPGTTFRRSGVDGFAGGAFMFHSYHGYDNQVQTQSITNGARFENLGQVWYGISGDMINEETRPGIRVVTTINGGHMDLSGGDQYALDNDNFLTRGDLSFIYNFKHDADPTNDEVYIINFTGPGSITVDGRISDPAQVLDIDGQHYSSQAEIDAAFGAGRGGIRIATQTNTAPGPSNYGNDRNIQRSYLDLWNAGILRAKNKSGLTGDVFGNFFSTTNNPGDNDYKLTSLVVADPPGVHGDFNSNGVVDGADYVVWRNSMGSFTDLRADANGSLHIDQADYIHWRNAFGNTSGSGTGQAAIPEPATMVLLIGLGFLVPLKARVRHG